MLTYVINTSENKTFDSKKLFSFAGYHKIVWIDCLLNEVENCALEIYEKQNALAATDFRVAVIIDFYSFDKIRKPYGTDGFSLPEEGVDLAVYYPFLEAYLADNLFDKLSRMNLKVEQRDIYYVQSVDNDGFDNLSNVVEQIKTILTPDESTKGEISDKNKKLIEKLKVETEKVPKDYSKVEECVHIIINALTQRRLPKVITKEKIEEIISDALEDQKLEGVVKEKLDEIIEAITLTFTDKELEKGNKREQIERIVVSALENQKKIKNPNDELMDVKKYTDEEIEE